MNYSLRRSANSARFQGANAPRSPRGFTLIEMLVAVAITMIMMLAIAQIFLYLGDNMDKSRAIIEMSGQLRNVSQRLQEDLDGLTCSTLPWTKLDAGDGYFEYLEGPNNDASAGVTSMLGDADDVLAFTTRSRGRPFVGRFGGNTVESELAEVIWWTSAADANGLRTLHRRVLLIRPDLSPAATDDISQRSGTANSLADLTIRQNRHAHNATFPNQINTTTLNSSVDLSREAVLSSVIGFDVKAWDPLAPLMNGTSSTLVPGDPTNAYIVATARNAPTGRGAYVDLGYAGAETVTYTSYYSSNPNSKSRLIAKTYSTWPFYYECDGQDQDLDTPLIDEGTNGFDDGGLSTEADDVGELETSPPYPHPGPFGTVATPITPNPKPIGLRGIQVRIRLVETGSRQVRQSTVVGKFLPE